MATQLPRRPRQKTGRVAATEYMLNLYMKDRIQMDCEHSHFYEDDSDGIFRCSYCGLVIDPDEVEGGLEDAKQAE